MDQGTYLSILTRVPAERIKPFVETLLPQIDGITVIENRTGLIMVPYRDTVQGETFHLGEMLVAEGRVSIADHEGYGVVMGRDLEQALAVAILDALLMGNKFTGQIHPFIQQEQNIQLAEEARLLSQVATTRVEMETF